MIRSRAITAAPSAGFFLGSTLDMRFSDGLYRGAAVGDLTVARASDGRAQDSAGNWINFSSNVARITNRGLFVEESRTNSILRSDEFDNASWTKSSVSVVADSASSPFGSVNADTLTATASNGTVTQGVTTTAISWTFSVFLRRLTGSGNVDITMDGTTWVTQTIGSTGWTRCSVTQTGVAGTSTPGIRIATSGDAVYAVGAQAEAGAFATSPIPTTTVAVTRAADVVDLGTAVTSPWLTGGVSGTLYTESIVPNTAAERMVMLIWDSTTNNRVNVAIGAGVVRSFIGTGGVAQYNISTGTPTEGELRKVAVNYTTNLVNSASNGTLGGADDTASTTPTIDRVRIGSISSSNSPYNSYIRRIAYFPFRLSNSEIQAITT